MNEQLPAIRAETVNNLSYWTVEDQLRLESSRVAVAGLGGAGGMVVELLARSGVASWALADPDQSSVENIGRQAGSSHVTVGVSKVDTAAMSIQGVHRGARIDRYLNGVTPNNLDAFLDGADVVLEAIDYEHAWLSVLLGRRARERGIPMITSLEIADGCQYTAFSAAPGGYETTVDAYFGVDPAAVADEMLAVPVEALLTYLPPNFPAGLIEALARGEVHTPAHAMGVARNASAISRAVRELLLAPQADHPFYYPRLIIDDPDPSVGVFTVLHADRPQCLQDSLAAVEASSTGRFSKKAEYRVT